ncbi:MAG: type II toxin-antitoxin system VapB family antitoxin [Verrucomicrobiales bacterium]|nr:type II toxin-antitoxin system VapB family antitoxin [Verrucomicrobiales bacterium]
MKVILNIDEDLLDHVVEFTGACTKTEAITIALKEMDRWKRLVDVLREGLGATVDELKNIFVRPMSESCS